MNDRFLRACRRQPVDCTPVWYMRQAGRYQPEYRAIRRRHSLLEICRQPDLCAEVTLLPVQQLGVDAAILFSDIMVPLGGMGVDFEIRENVGPIVHRPLRTAVDVAALRPLEPAAAVPYVLETIGILRRELQVPLIGFSGAPFTLASYLVEGQPSRNYVHTKGMMYAEPATWAALMTRLTDMVITYLRSQVAAGAQALQVFDSWAGALDPVDYRAFVLPHMQRLFAGLGDLGVPVIHFGVGTATLLELLRESGGDVIGIDWRVPMDQARRRLGTDVALQGNLDPVVLLSTWAATERKARAVLEQVGPGPGHIFNLGHGVLPETPVAQLQRLAEFVHRTTEQGGGRP